MVLVIRRVFSMQSLLYMVSVLRDKMEVAWIGRNHVSVCDVYFMFSPIFVVIYRGYIC